MPDVDDNYSVRIARLSRILRVPHSLRRPSIFELIALVARVSLGQEGVVILDMT
jgi:hypothetical protein